ncbi:MAG: hypothetical protein J6K33_06015 [Alistipes sp.]|nr:hypothetical protein [Alistipes sp.]
MRRFILTISTLLFALTATAQVEREVEVTKQYVPKLPAAKKMDFQPDMVDTVAIRPEIDYTIVPKSFASALSTEKFRPAKVTYWEYSKSYPFYIKAGVGYPLVSEVDAYASTNRADVGYLSAYVNHRGSYSDIQTINPITNTEFKGKAQQMSNRVGVNGGKYIGRYTFNGDVYYDADIFHRYAQPKSDDAIDEINYENIALAMSFGDSFADMSKVNFSIYAAADYYNDKSEQLPDFERKMQQFSALAGLKFGRNIGTKARLYAAFDYQGNYGLKFLENYGNSLFSGAVKFEYNLKSLLDIKAELKYCNDKLTGQKSRHHILPNVYVGFNVGQRDIFVPYVEVDSRLEQNSYQHLQQANPYIMLRGSEYQPLPNTTIFNMRVGFTGHTTNNKLSYRLNANAAFMNDALYWINVNNIGFDVTTAAQNIITLNASLEYKPLSTLLLGAGFKWMLYDENFVDVENGKPNFEANFNIQYTHRKFAIGAKADIIGSRSWSFAGEYFEGDVRDNFTLHSYTYPVCCDLGLTFDWFVAKQCAIYIEGRNLGNAKIYDYALYRRLGVGAVAGIKVQF